MPNVMTSTRGYRDSGASGPNVNEGHRHNHRGHTNSSKVDDNIVVMVKGVFVVLMVAVVAQLAHGKHISGLLDNLKRLNSSPQCLEHLPQEVRLALKEVPPQELKVIIDTYHAHSETIKNTSSEVAKTYRCEFPCREDARLRTQEVGLTGMPGEAAWLDYRHKCAVWKKAHCPAIRKPVDIARYWLREIWPLVQDMQEYVATLKLKISDLAFGAA